MENNDQITALAREYAEEITKADAGDPSLSASDLNGIKHDVAEYAEQLIRWLLRRYCLAEKEKLDNIYQGILVQLDPKNFGCSPYNQGRMDVIKSLFPDLGKEVEG